MLYLPTLVLDMAVSHAVSAFVDSVQESYVGWVSGELRMEVRIRLLSKRPEREYGRQHCCFSSLCALPIRL